MAKRESSNFFGFGDDGCPVHGDEFMKECSMCGAEFCARCHPGWSVCPDCSEPDEEEHTETTELEEVAELLEDEELPDVPDEGDEELLPDDLAGDEFDDRF